MIVNLVKYLNIISHHNYYYSIIYIQYSTLRKCLHTIISLDLSHSSTVEAVQGKGRHHPESNHDVQRGSRISSLRT